MSLNYFLFEIESEARDAKILFDQKKTSIQKLKNDYYHAVVSEKFMSELSPELKFSLQALKSGEMSSVFQTARGYILCYRA